VGQFVLQSNLLPARWRGRRLQTVLGELELHSRGEDGHGSPEAVEVMVRPQALEFLPEEEGRAWVGSLLGSHEEGTFFAAGSYYTFFASKKPR
jgi:hypothetical protein